MRLSATFLLSNFIDAERPLDGVETVEANIFSWSREICAFGARCKMAPGACGLFAGLPAGRAECCVSEARHLG
jgi:hypothetical protein